MTALTHLTITEARARLAARDISAGELTDAHIAAAERIRPLNAFITETFDIERRQASEADTKLKAGAGGALEGIPLGIKDRPGTKDVLTTPASHIPDAFHPPYEST